MYLIPKTSVLGAILLTAWLGGAVATHIIHKDAVGMQLFPALFGVLVWVSLWLRNEKLNAVFPINK
jgi:fucose permease